MKIFRCIKTLTIAVFLFDLIILTQQQATDSVDEDNDDDDECAFISGQHCDQNGICKYCAMCLQSSCILSKTVGNNAINSPTTGNCNTTQFGTTNLYNWYDYCLSSDNDSEGSYCATSTECYQYRKSAGPSVTYAWHNLTCNPSTCMLIASNGAPPPVPLPPQINNNNNGLQNNSHNTTTVKHHHQGGNISNAADRHGDNEYRSLLHNPSAIALIIVCCLVIVIVLFWVFHLCKKKHWWPFPKANKNRHRRSQIFSHNSITSSVPSSAPPSFSSAPSEMANIHSPRTVYAAHHSSITSGQSWSSTNTNELLPSYLSPYASPPKYEQAIVTQIRGLREESSSSSSASDHHRNPPSMWVPVYFTQPQFGRRGTVELFGFTPNYPMPSYFIHPSPVGQQEPPTSNPFDDSQETQEDNTCATSS